MPLELKRAQESAHKTTVKLPITDESGDLLLEEVEVVFKPLTFAMLEELEAEKLEDMSVLEAKALTLSKELIRWSIVNEGRPVEPTFEILRTLNRLQLDALLEGITAYTYPKE
jgi:hypothetical protein